MKLDMKLDMNILIYIYIYFVYMVATQKTYVSCKNSDTYSVSRRFLPSRFWELFWRGHHI